MEKSNSIIHTTLFGLPNPRIRFLGLVHESKFISTIVKSFKHIFILKYMKYIRMF